MLSMHFFVQSSAHFRSIENCPDLSWVRSHWLVEIELVDYPEEAKNKKEVIL